MSTQQEMFLSFFECPKPGISFQKHVCVVPEVTKNTEGYQAEPYFT